MKILFSFDDASVEDMEIAELMVKYKFIEDTVFYFPVSPSVVNERKGRQSLSKKHQHEIAELFEIGSHTITHPLLTRISTSSAKTEILDSRKMLKTEFGQSINKFCYPRGYANPEIQTLVKEAGYKNARSTLVGYIHQSENPYFEQTTAHVGCDRKEYGGQHWFSYAKTMLAEARNTPDSIYHLWGHGYELKAYPKGLYLFEELLKELQNER